MNMIKKAVILAGGRGTRLLPYTKACPKEMFALADKPVLHYIVKEAVDAGVEKVLIIINPEKELIKNYFTKNDVLDEFLLKNGKTAEYDMLKKIESMADISYAVQVEAKGSGDALFLAEKFADGESVAVMNADDLMRAPDGRPSVMAQVIGCYERNRTSVLAVQEVEPEIVVKCGAVNIVSRSNRDLKIDRVVEKPAIEDAPSHMVTLGRYVLTPDYFDVLKRTPIAKNGELNMTDALNIMAVENGIYAYEFEGKRYDMGNKLGCFEAMLDYALSDDEIGVAARKIVLNKF